nr:DNA primase [Streptomyces sp. SID7815]
MPLDDDVEAEEEAEDDAEAAGLESVFDEADPVDESDALEDDVAGVLLDEEPRLSFR